MNDALMGILQVRHLLSPPYVHTQPSLQVHEISNSDQFVVLGSDGLFDFFENDDVVRLVHSYIVSNPSGDPAKYLVEQLLVKAADSAGTCSFSISMSVCILYVMDSKIHHPTSRINGEETLENYSQDILCFNQLILALSCYTFKPCHAMVIQICP